MKAKIMFSMFGVVSAMSAKCRQLQALKTRTYAARRAANKPFVQAFDRLKYEACLLPNFKTSAYVEGNDIILTSLFINTVKWMKKGIDCKVGGQDGIELKDGFVVVNKDIAVLRTKSGDLVWLVRGEVATDAVKLHERCATIRRKYADKLEALKLKSSEAYEGIRFPKVTAHQSNTVKGIFGTQSSTKAGELLTATDCQQAIDFELALTGASVKVKTTLVLTKGLGMRQVQKKKFWTLAGTFTVFMTNPSLSEPYFTATFVKGTSTNEKPNTKGVAK